LADVPETTESAPSADSGGSQQQCSYAAVFDGHSAADAADMAAKRLHVLLTGELRALDRCRHAPTSVHSCLACTCSAHGRRRALLCVCGGCSQHNHDALSCPSLIYGNDGCSDEHWDRQVVTEALIRTFSAMDGEILADAARSGARCGSTACVALQLGADLYVAHAGARFTSGSGISQA
jgi:serine/threonine protein phosphatase PrpC